MANEMKASKASGEGNWLVRLLTAKKPLGLVLRIVLPPVIAYAYLMLCGLVFDWWLHKYELTNFIFYSFVTLGVIACIFVIAAIVMTIKSGNLKKEKN